MVDEGADYKRITGIMLFLMLLFPVCAVLWLLVCDRLGWVDDQPARGFKGRPEVSARKRVVEWQSERTA